jgi:hypothetical protein
MRMADNSVREWSKRDASKTVSQNSLEWSGGPPWVQIPPEYNDVTWEGKVLPGLLSNRPRQLHH